jgi:hypothetical protein
LDLNFRSHRGLLGDGRVAPGPVLSQTHRAIAASSPRGQNPVVLKIVAPSPVTILLRWTNPLSTILTMTGSPPGPMPIYRNLPDPLSTSRAPNVRTPFRPPGAQPSQRPRSRHLSETAHRPVRDEAARRKTILALGRGVRAHRASLGISYTELSQPDDCQSRRN